MSYYIKGPRPETHAIVLRLECGHSLQTTVYATRKQALGRAFGEAKEIGLPATAVLFCKTQAEMSEDERWQWGMQTPADERRWQRHCDAIRTPARDLDLH